jgi:hypothetical protein
MTKVPDAVRLEFPTLNFPVQDWLSRNLTISEHLTCQKCISPADLLCSIAPQDYPLPDQTDGG